MVTFWKYLFKKYWNALSLSLPLRLGFWNRYKNEILLKLEDMHKHRRNVDSLSYVMRPLHESNNIGDLIVIHDCEDAVAAKEWTSY